MSVYQLAIVSFSRARSHSRAHSLTLAITPFAIEEGKNISVRAVGFQKLCGDSTETKFAKREEEQARRHYYCRERRMNIEQYLKVPTSMDTACEALLNTSSCTWIDETLKQGRLACNRPPRLRQAPLPPIDPNAQLKKSKVERLMARGTRHSPKKLRALINGRCLKNAQKLEPAGESEKKRVGTLHTQHEILLERCGRANSQKPEPAGESEKKKIGTLYNTQHEIPLERRLRPESAGLTANVHVSSVHVSSRIVRAPWTAGETEATVLSGSATDRSKTSVVACTHWGTSERKTVRQLKTIELMTNPQGPVLDYSFLEIQTIEELTSVAPRSGYRERPPEKIETKDAFGKVKLVENPLLKTWEPPPVGPGGQALVTEGLKLSNNHLTSLPGATHIVLREVLERSWLLRWIDLSFNNIESIPEVLSSYLRLNTIYLHANRIRNAAQVFFPCFPLAAALANFNVLTLYYYYLTLLLTNPPAH